MAQSYTPLVGTDLFGDSYTTLNNSDEALRTVFAGTAAPTSPVSYQLWLDTTNNLLKQRNTANDGWLALGKFATDMGHLALDGGQMTAPGSGGTGLDMNGAAITNLPAGSGTGPARQQEVDLKAPLASPAFTTDATLNVDPVSGNSLTRQSYTDGRYLKKAGDTLTGALNLSGPATGANHPIRKTEFDAEFSGTGHKHDGTANEGRKILATDLDSDDAANNRVLVADGGGNALWGNVAGAAIVTASIVAPKLKTTVLEFQTGFLTQPTPGVLLTPGVGGDGVLVLCPQIKSSNSGTGSITALRHDSTSFGISSVVIDPTPNGSTQYTVQFVQIEAA